MNKKELLVISIGIFLTIVAWMVADLYHTKQTTVVEEIVNQADIPTYKINPTIFSILKEKSP